MDRETKLTIIDKCRQYKLHPCYSESRGLHIYAFIGENSYVSCNTMRNFLRKICKYLGLSPKTEIFPIQDRGEGDEIGNGIKIPYRAWNLHSQKGQTGIGIVVNPHKKTENPRGALLASRGSVAISVIKIQAAVWLVMWVTFLAI